MTKDENNKSSMLNQNFEEVISLALIVKPVLRFNRWRLTVSFQPDDAVFGRLTFFNVVVVYIGI
jgi:hypothetical protein